MRTPIDLEPQYLDILIRILKKNLPKNAIVWAFGSRATGQVKPYSDIDLAINCEKPLPLEILANLSTELEESALPYKVDIVDWQTISETFRQNIINDIIEIMRT